MDVSGLSLVTVVLFLPMVGLTILMFMNEEKQRQAIKWTAFGFTVATFLAALLMWSQFDASNPGMQFIQRDDWLPTFGVSYFVGVDGLSLILVLLTTFIMPLAVLISHVSQRSSSFGAASIRSLMCGYSYSLPSWPRAELLESRNLSVSSRSLAASMRKASKPASVRRSACRTGA